MARQRSKFGLVEYILVTLIVIVGGIALFFILLSGDSQPSAPTPQPTATAIPTATRRPPTARPVNRPPATARPAQPQRNTGSVPGNCTTAVAMGLTARQAAQYDRLDRDKDGVACYGD